MKARGNDPRRLDVARFAQEGATLQGRWPLATMARLADLVRHAPDAVLEWSAHGELRPEHGSAPRVALRLEGQVPVELQCQRCLGPLAHTLVVGNRYGFVEDEDTAARLDAEIDEDVLALTPELDLHDLFEDELLLALPLVPRHEDCRLPLGALAAEGGGEVPHPFAALAALRKPTAG